MYKKVCCTCKAGFFLLIRAIDIFCRSRCRHRLALHHFIFWVNYKYTNDGFPSCCLISHSEFRVPNTLTFKTRLSSKLSCENEFYLHENKQSIFISMALSLVDSLVSLSNKGLGRLGNGPFRLWFCLSLFCPSYITIMINQRKTKMVCMGKRTALLNLNHIVVIETLIKKIISPSCSSNYS